MSRPTALEAAAETCNVEANRMDSAAMHDTATVTPLTNTGLVFAPSRDGVSHSPAEWTDWDDCAEATLALVRNRYVSGEIFVVDGGLTQVM